MLAELAAANAAFAVIKQAVTNGKEIAAAGSAIAEFVGAKEKLQAKAAKKGGGSDLEEFMALETIREQEEQLNKLTSLVLWTTAFFPSFNSRVAFIKHLAFASASAFGDHW